MNKYPVGSTCDISKLIEKPEQHSYTFYWMHFVIDEGDKITLTGSQSSTGSARLLLVTSFADNKVLFVSPHADQQADNFNDSNPITFTAPCKCEVLSLSTNVPSKCILQKNFFVPEEKPDGLTKEGEEEIFNFLSSFELPGEKRNAFVYMNKYPEGSFCDIDSLIKTAESHVLDFYWRHSFLKEGDKLILTGRQSNTASARLLLVTRLIDGKVLYLSPHENGVEQIYGKDSPLIYTASEDCEFLSLSTTTVGTCKVVRNQFPKSSVLTDVTKKLNQLETGVEMKVPSLYIPPVPFHKKEFRVLDIGNSYTGDATHYLGNLVTSAGIDPSDMAFVTAVRGSGSFKTWYDLYHDKDNSTYTVSKLFGGLDVNLEGQAGANNGEQFRNILKNNKFDLIVIHQVSSDAPYFARWEGNGTGGYLKELLLLLRALQPQAAIGFHLIHSYWSGYGSNTEKSSLERWKLIAESALKLKALYGIDFIIPYGTAIQNLRSSSLNNEYDLTADGTHCADGLADYTAACTYFQSLISPRYGVSVLGNLYRVTVSQSEQYGSSDISVTDQNAPIAQKAAILACCDISSVINPENVELP